MTKIQQSFDTKIVGEKIKKLRVSRSMKQDELGEILNLSRPQISNLERGRRNINLHQIKTLADFFGVSLEALGLKIEEIETNDLLFRAKLIFENEDVPLQDKRELAEMVYSLYLSAKEQTKK